MLHGLPCVLDDAWLTVVSILEGDAKSRVLILGATGFIGGACARAMAALGHEVLGAGRHFVSNLPIRPYEMRTLDADDLERLVEDFHPDLCLNAAGSGSPAGSVKLPTNDFTANTLLVQRVLETLRTHAPQCRYIGFSSAAVYGDSPELPWTEDARLCPRSPYGYHKFCAELLAEEYHHVYGLATLSLRAFSVYGPGLSKQLFWDLFQRSRATSELSMFGTGQETRDFLYIDDLVAGIGCLAANAPFSGETLNLGSGRVTTVSEACEMLLHALDWRGVHRFTGNEIPGSPPRMEADMTRTFALGFRPEIDLVQGLRLTAAWLLEHMKDFPVRPTLTICVHNKVGGVQFFYSNLLHTGAFEAFDVRYLVMDFSGDCDTRLDSPLEGAPSRLVEFGGAESVHRAFRRFSRQLPDRPGLVLTNWHFELSALDARRRPDLTILHFCHDEVYVDTASQYAHLIDAFIVHNPYFAERLKTVLPPDRVEDIHFLPFGIIQDQRRQRAPNPARPLRVVFIGRLHRTKGALELPAVDDHLRKLGVAVEWSVLGSGPEQAALESALVGRDNFTIQAPGDASDMLREAARGDVFLLPSRLDGTPLAVIEAMSVGMVPIVSEFNSGARWMVPPETGFVCPIEPAVMAGFIARLHADRSELEARSQAALRHARENFDVFTRARGYAEFFHDWRRLKRIATGPPARYGDWFDRPWFPNAVVVALRRLQQWRRRVLCKQA